MDKLYALQHYLGYSTFAPGQEEAIDALLDGFDVLNMAADLVESAVLYQIPALIMPGTGLVVSSQERLMRQQAAMLRENGVATACLYPGVQKSRRADVIRRAKQGRYKIIYLTPEFLHQADFVTACESFAISLVVVGDEQRLPEENQGAAFSYLLLALFLDQLLYRPIICAYTADSTLSAFGDIAHLLRMRQPRRMSIKSTATCSH